MTLFIESGASAVFVASCALVFCLAGCSSDGSSVSEGSGGAHGSGGEGSGGAQEPEDTDPTADDFACLTKGTAVKGFFISNRFGASTDDAVAVANEPNGGTYPVGTIVQLLPGEAMVKRHAGFSAESRDWEFFFLGVTAEGVEIKKRGTTDVPNAFGLNCLDCHRKADPKFDMVCGKDHGCDPLPLTTEQITALQGTDPRCGG